MYVYWWHVRGLRAVKVGHADDPSQRVSSYRSDYRLSGNDVRGYRLGNGTDAEWVQRQLCRLLEIKGFRRFTLGDGEEAFYALGGRTFENAHQLLRDTARHIALAEASNRRKEQMRRGPQVANVSTSRQGQQTSQGHEDRHPRQRHSAPSVSPVTVRRWLYPIGAIVLLCLAAGSSDQELGLRSADRSEPQNPSTASALQDGDSSGGSQQSSQCTLAELSETLIHVNCAGSWARMRWAEGWVLDGGRNEAEALDFFNASDAARKVIALPSRESLPPIAEKPEIKPEKLPQSNQTAVTAPPPPQPRSQQVAPRPATAQQQRLQEPSGQCTVSRPKPGLQVYVVTCPNSRAMIGRTVDLPTAWTVSEGVNATEAVEFFLKSPYAR